LNETQERILDLIESGVKVPDACKAVGIRLKLHRSWLKTDAVYASAVIKARTPVDPTPEEIEERSAAIRDKWTAARWAEYKASPWRATVCRSGLDMAPSERFDSDDRVHVELPVEDDGDG
jgi:hypothetical protein